MEREKSVLGRGGRRGGAGGQPHGQEKVRVGGATWAKGGVGWLGLALSRLFFFFMCYILPSFKEFVPEFYYVMINFLSK